MNIGALDFLFYPYQKSDLQRMLRLAIGTGSRSTRQQDPIIGSDLQTGEAA
jgi:FixJ family two-component response regulator